LCLASPFWVFFFFFFGLEHNITDLYRNIHCIVNCFGSSDDRVHLYFFTFPWPARKAGGERDQNEDNCEWTIITTSSTNEMNSLRTGQKVSLGRKTGIQHCTLG